MAFVVVVILIGLIPAAIASSKGRSFVLWWIYGMALFIVALPHALIMGPAGDKRNCPHCGEYMLATANVCPHCSRDVKPGMQESSVPATGPKTTDAGAIILQRPSALGGTAWSKVAPGKRLKLTRANTDETAWTVESEDGLLGSVTGDDAKRIAFFAETDGKPRGTVADFGTVDERGPYRLSFTLSAVPGS